MIDISRACSEPERLVLTFIRAMELGTLPAVIASHLADDFCWENSGLPAIQGRDQLLAHMASGGFASQIPILQTMTHFSADLLHIASSGGVVFTERIDHHWDESGRDLMTPHICGVAEVADGRITAFRDFYDVACYQQAPGNVVPGFSLAEWQKINQEGVKP